MSAAVEVLNAEPLLDARHRVEQIRSKVEDIKTLVVEAYQARDWETLGYANWADYCTSEFGGTIVIPREERGDVVFTLRDAGLSTRAISAAFDIPRSTVSDLSRVRDRTPEPVTDPQRHFVPQHHDLDDEVLDAEIVEEPEPASEPPRVTGTDNKSYRARRPAGNEGPSPRRRTGASVLVNEDPATLGPDSAPKGQTWTYRDCFAEAVLSVGNTCILDDAFPADKVALIAVNDDEYQAWIDGLRKARRTLSTYIHALEGHTPEVRS